MLGLTPQIHARTLIPRSTRRANRSPSTIPRAGGVSERPNEAVLKTAARQQCQGPGFESRSRRSSSQQPRPGCDQCRTPSTLPPPPTASSPAGPALSGMDALAADKRHSNPNDDPAALPPCINPGLEPVLQVTKVPSPPAPPSPAPTSAPSELRVTSPLVRVTTPVQSSSARIDS